MDKGHGRGPLSITKIRATAATCAVAQFLPHNVGNIVRFISSFIVFLSAIIVAGAFFSPSSALQARPIAFAQCAACHSTQPGKIVLGPSLAALNGRRAGSLEGFAYSAGLKSSGIIWDAKSLDRWLTSPKKTVPGTKMLFNGVQDRAARQQIIAYLLTL